MAVAVDLELTPSLEEVRELAKEHSLVPLRHTFIADCETPVSAYLKLRGDGPSFLLESAEQGQQVGRWSFLGFRPRAVIRLAHGGHPDPYRLVDEELAGYRMLLDNLSNCSANMHSGSGIGRGSSYNCFNAIAADLGLVGQLALAR